MASHSQFDYRALAREASRQWKFPNRCYLLCGYCSLLQTNMAANVGGSTLQSWKKVPQIKWAGQFWLRRFRCWMSNEIWLWVLSNLHIHTALCYSLYVIHNATHLYSGDPLGHERHISFKSVAIEERMLSHKHTAPTGNEVWMLCFSDSIAEFKK